MKKLLSLLIAAMLLLSSLTAFAEPDDESGENGVPSDVFMEDTGLTPPTVSHARAALLMDMKSGRILYGKNIDEKLFPASTTKMMTGILALENGNLDDTVTATYEAIKDITLEDSHMGILIGEELKFKDLVNGMLVYSANDAANVIAIHIAGSVDKFVDMMNAKAQEIGMNNTHFVNACGIQNDQHYTTAEDLATLARYCMQNEQFREIVKTPVYKMAPTNKYAMDRVLPSTNLFLGTSRSSYNYYQPCTGIKTGHTRDAGYCLVSSAEYKDMSLIAVVLKCDNEDEQQRAYSYSDSKKLFEFGFNNYTSKKIASPGDVVADSKVYEAKSDTRVALTVSEDIYALTPTAANTEGDITAEVEKQGDLSAPIAKGTALGKVVYTCNGVRLASADLVAANDVERDVILHILHSIIKVITNPILFVPVILLIIIALISRGQKKKRERKRRIQQLKRNKQRANRVPDRNASQTQIRDQESKGSNSRYKK